MNQPDIVLYTKANCMPCTMTKRALDNAGLAYEERTIDPDLAESFREYYGFREAPVVDVYEYDKWCGFRPDLIKELADGR